MPDKVSGFLEVGRNDNGEIVMNSPKTDLDANGAGFWIFSPNQARNLARLLNKHAREADRDRVAGGSVNAR